MISPRPAQADAKSLPGNAPARQKVRSNARVVGQRRRKRSHDTQSGQRLDALQNRARPPQKKPRGREGDAVNSNALGLFFRRGRLVVACGDRMTLLPLGRLFVQWNFVPSKPRFTSSPVTIKSGKSCMNSRAISAIAARPTAGGPSFTLSEPLSAKNAPTRSRSWLRHASA